MHSVIFDLFGNYQLDGEYTEKDLFDLVKNTSNFQDYLKKYIEEENAKREKAEAKKAFIPVDIDYEAKKRQRCEPFILCNKEGETIISYIVKRINKGLINPFDVEWSKITLLCMETIKDILDQIDAKRGLT